VHVLEHVKDLDLIEAQFARIVVFNRASEALNAGRSGLFGLCKTRLDAIGVDADLFPHQREGSTVSATDLEHFVTGLSFAEPTSIARLHAVPRVHGRFERHVAGLRVGATRDGVSDVAVVLAVAGRVVLGHGLAGRPRGLIDQSALVARDVAHVHVEASSRADLEPARAHAAHGTEWNFSRFGG